jgi:hypothetical protein
MANFKSRKPRNRNRPHHLKPPPHPVLTIEADSISRTGIRKPKGSLTDRGLLIVLTFAAAVAVYALWLYAPRLQAQAAPPAIKAP